MRNYILLAYLTIIITDVFGQDIDLKGVRIGMPKDEVMSIIHSTPIFTIAGIESKYVNIPASMQYRNGNLDTFVFFFSSRRFEQMQDALEKKYPKLRCVDSHTKNAMNATFTQTICEIDNANVLLQLRRFVSDITTSSLSLVSHESLEELKNKRKQEKSDI